MVWATCHWYIYYKLKLVSGISSHVIRLHRWRAYIQTRSFGWFIQSPMTPDNACVVMQMPLQNEAHCTQICVWLVMWSFPCEQPLILQPYPWKCFCSECTIILSSQVEVSCSLFRLCYVMISHLPNYFMYKSSHQRITSLTSSVEIFVSLSFPQIAPRVSVDQKKVHAPLHTAHRREAFLLTIPLSHFVSRSQLFVAISWVCWTWFLDPQILVSTFS